MLSVQSKIVHRLNTAAVLSLSPVPVLGRFVPPHVCNSNLVALFSLRLRGRVRIDRDVLMLLVVALNGLDRRVLPLLLLLHTLRS